MTADMRATRAAMRRALCHASTDAGVACRLTGDIVVALACYDDQARTEDALDALVSRAFREAVVL